MSEDEWEIIWEYQWKCSSSQSWKEFGWKSLIRYFITPYQKSHYRGNSPACWRNCGNMNANHYHVFWGCQVIKTYWKEIHKAIQDIFGSHLPLQSKVFFFGLMPDGWTKRDKHLFSILLVAGKKALTKKMAFTGESNIDHVDGHHDGYMQDGEINCRFELPEGLVCFTLEEMDRLYNITQAGL